MKETAIEFVYVSSVRGRLVPRFATGEYIGATRVGKRIEWDTEKVVAIPVSEFNRFRLEYKRCLKDGSLVRRTPPIQSQPEQTADSANEGDMA